MKMCPLPKDDNEKVGRCRCTLNDEVNICDDTQYCSVVDGQCNKLSKTNTCYFLKTSNTPLIYISTNVIYDTFHLFFEH